MYLPPVSVVLTPVVALGYESQKEGQALDVQVGSVQLARRKGREYAVFDHGVYSHTLLPRHAHPVGQQKVSGSVVQGVSRVATVPGGS